MIRMMSGIIDEDRDILIESSSYDVLSNLSKKYYDTMKSSHSDWIDKQKDLFKKLNNDNDDDNIYKILTNKYDEHMNKPLSLFMDTMKVVAKYQLENDADDKKRIQVIKSFIKHHSGLRDRNCATAINDIGYEFKFSYIGEKKIEDIYSRIKEDMMKGRDISKDNIAERIYKDYRNLSKLDDMVHDGLEVIISSKDNLSIGKVVDKYDDILSTRTALMKDNISKFNKAYSKIGLEHKVAIATWMQKMKKIKNSGVDGEIAHAAYTRCMTNMSTINAITQHLLDSCYIIMKESLHIIADSDKASTELTKAIMTDITDLNLDRG